MTARFTAVALLAACAGAGTLPAQTIRIGENVRVARGPERRPLVEPHVAAHPRDPSRLVAATIVADTGAENTRTQTCAAFFSEDAGRSWSRRDLGIAHCYDPWVAITPGGDAVLAALGVYPMTSEQHSGLVVFHSPDGGRAWADAPTRLGAGRDHPTIAVDSSSSGRRGTVYVVASDAAPDSTRRLRFGVTVARSHDGGRTFEDEARVVPSNLNLNAEHAAVLSDGSIVVSFVDTQRRPLGGFAEEGGDLDRRRAWVLRSTDGGRTFSVPLFATEACAMGWTSMAASTGPGPSRDRLYLACREKGANAIVLTSSADSGETWTDPVRVRPPARGRDAVPVSPALAVNRAGVLGVAWVERRRARPRGVTLCDTIAFSASVDGGRTFLSPRAVNDRRSCPTRSANGAAYDRWPYGGDYFGIAAAADGRFHLLWADAREDVFQLWTAVVRVEVGPSPRR